MRRRARPRPAGLGANPPAAWRGVARMHLPSWATFHSAPQAGGGLRPTPPGRQCNGKAHSARRGSRRLRLSVRRRARPRPADPGGTPPQPGGGLLERICPVGPLFIVPRRLAGGCAPPQGRARAAAPWLSAAGRRLSGQAIGRVCVQWAKEALGSQAKSFLAKRASWVIRLACSASGQSAESQLGFGP